ncbi:hypothetical protein [Labedaea rhizosphaerae]|nr:hypothetical protein [Labedaea rhizosphaerae]
MSTPGDRDESADEVKAEPERPIMPTAAEAKAAQGTDPTPRPVQTAIGMLFASGAVCLIAGILVLLFRQAQIDYQVQHPPAPNLTRDDIAGNVTIQAVLLIIAAVVNAAFIWLFGIKVRIGDKRSRTRLTVIVLLLGLFQFFFGSPISAFGVLIGLIGLIMLFLPSVKSFFVKQ